MVEEDNLTAFITRIASEEFLPLDDGLSDDDWERGEVQQDMLRRVQSGRAAEILFRTFEWYQYECAGPPAFPVSCALGIPQWYFFSAEALWVPHDRTVLFWEKEVGATNLNEQRFFARRLSCEECKRFLELAGPEGIRWY